jgi:hypothetical protein
MLSLASYCRFACFGYLGPLLQLPAGLLDLFQPGLQSQREIIRQDHLMLVLQLLLVQPIET